MITIRQTVLLVVAASLIGSTAFAAGRGAKNRAKRHFKAAEMHYELGRFDEALREYSQAYEEWSQPAFLFNIAQCHSELKNYERAVFFYDGYLRELPNASSSAMVRERLEEATAALAAEEAKKQELEQQRLAQIEAEAETARLEEERKRLEVERAQLAKEAEAARKEQALKAPPPAPSGPPPPAVKKSEPIVTQWWFWAIVGGVAVATAGGVTAGVVASSNNEIRVLPSGKLETIDGR